MKEIRVSGCGVCSINLTFTSELPPKLHCGLVCECLSGADVCVVSYKCSAVNAPTFSALP